MPKTKIRVGITMGDPAGIGPEIILKSLPYCADLGTITVIGDGGVFARLGSWPDKIKGVAFIDVKNVASGKFCFGQIKREYGKASIEYLDIALALLEAKEIDCLVTAPISKEAINRAGFKFRGHTEYLRDYTDSAQTVMMLLNQYLRFSLVTRHAPLESVSRLLNQSDLLSVINITFHALKRLFGVREPRIVVCGLNPHASDNGVIGREENSVIKPALRKLKSRIKHLEGPFSSDIAVSRAHAGDYDAVIAMYHDQALIPLKLSDPLGGVNMTLGLPFVRTSPLHGTAFDIAGKNLAQPRSMIEAVRLAVRCAGNIKG